MIHHAKKSLATLLAVGLAGCASPRDNNNFYIGVAGDGAAADCPHPGAATPIESLYFSSTIMTAEARAVAAKLQCDLKSQTPTAATPKHTVKPEKQ